MSIPRSSEPDHQPPAVHTPSSRVLVLEGMPGAGKTTVADELSRCGHLVVPEYAAVDGTVIEHAEHPEVDHDAAHQRNWLRKHQLAATWPSRDPAGERPYDAVWMDRDWITSLAYAYSLTEETSAGRDLMAGRCRWALDHLTTDGLAVPAAYLVLMIDPAQSLQRRRGRLERTHPWSHPAPLQRLAEFYRDPAAAIERFSPGLAAAAAAADWIHLEEPTRQQAVDTATFLTSTGWGHQ
ncbi:AAA family ATPase [Nocardioides sp. NPDC057764]|uniref:AAA family ATPase n=1 Tax=Nocardioides sp. NPDC057764 TaxID=3346243 RepID=UPI0036734C0D